MKIRAHPDLSGAAPPWAAWSAIDEDAYDGAPDSGTRNNIGYGYTEQEAIADLKRLLDEIAEAQEPEEPRE